MRESVFQGVLLFLTNIDTRQMKYSIFNRRCECIKINDSGDIIVVRQMDYSWRKPVNNKLQIHTLIQLLCIDGS